ncbi:hypothetical protein BE20_01170 [Sorangium cellulosum]|nr:hypothetical protein BE20_01170 [Sorangium cellulosum]
MIPARTSDDFPTPEAPTMARSGWLFRRATMPEMSSSRPKKRSASTSWKADRPAKGLSAAPRTISRRPGRSGVSSARSCWAEAKRSERCQRRHRAMIGPSGPRSLRAPPSARTGASSAAGRAEPGAPASSNGCAPVTSSWSMIPTAQISVAWSISSPARCSGDI